MKMSIYQFKCLGPCTIKENKLAILAYDYASAGDFWGFDQYRIGDYQSLGLSIRVDLTNEVGTVYHWDDDEDFDGNGYPAKVWYINDRMYVGLIFLKCYPIIFEIIPGSIWIIAFYSEEHDLLNDLAEAFTDNYECIMQDH